MKPEEKNVEEVLKRYWSSASQEEAETDCNRVLHRLRATAEHAPKEDHANSAFLSFFGTRLVMVSAAAAVLFAVVIGTMIVRAPATLEDFAGSRKIQFGEVVLSGDETGSALELADNSRVEMRAKSELFLERAHDGVRIRLSKGSVLVTAAKQHNGHLYVQTKDVTVSVIGTVFLVNAEEEGSRVAVIEGEVSVKQGGTETSLRRGEQVATNPQMEPRIVSKEREWSHEAETQLASLLQGQQGQQGAAPSPVPAVAPAAPASAQEKFEVASIRFKPAVDGGRGVPGNSNACLNPKIQIDPHRLSISGLSLNNLIVLAYPEWADARGGCYAVSAAGILSGGPEWVRSDRWDVEATIPEGPVDYKVTTSEPPRGARGRGLPPVTVVDDIGRRVRGMLQNLLADRFQLVLRPQTKDMPVYFLTVGKDGFKSNGNPGWAMANGQPVLLNGAQIGGVKYRGLRRIIESGGKPLFLKPEGAAYEEYESLGIWKFSMPEFAMSLNEEMQRPVIDRTNLTGTFDFHLDYTNATCCANPTRPTIFKALEDVGLKLESSRAPVEVWVIERAERPTEN